MAQILSVLASASKLVLLGLTLTSCIAFLQGKLDSKDFMILNISVYAFYFKWNPGSDVVNLNPPAPPAVNRTSTITETSKPAEPIPPA